MASVKEDFPRILKSLMASGGMNKSQLASALKVSNSTVGDWLRGKILPELGRIDDIARVFGVDRRDLVGVPDELPTAVRSRDLDAILQELARARGYRLVKQDG